MSVHYVTYDTPEGRGRTWGNLTDAEFSAVMAELDWVLPKGVHIYHFEDGEHVDNSRRAREFGKMPELDLARLGYVSSPTIKDGVWLLRMLHRQDQRPKCDACGSIVHETHRCDSCDVQLGPCCWTLHWQGHPSTGGGD